MESIKVTYLSLEELSGVKEWALEVNREWPQQGNGSDCGLFTAIGCECLALDMEMILNKEDAMLFQQKMGNAIIKEKLE